MRNVTKAPLENATADTAPSQPGVEPRGRGPGKPFAKGNAGRAKGSKNRVHTEAKDWALPLVPEVLRRRFQHRRACDAAKSCAQCRHYDTMVLEYAYGKAPQRTELIMAGLKADTEALAKSMGLDETATKAAVAEVERHYQALRSS